MTRALPGVRSLTVEEVAVVLDTRGEVTLVDIREPEEVRLVGSIPGAVHIPRGLLEFRADPTCASHHPDLDPARTTIVYSASGSRSVLAARTLRDLGYRDVVHLDGGLAAWQARGRPVSRRHPSEPRRADTTRGEWDAGPP